MTRSFAPLLFAAISASSILVALEWRKVVPGGRGGVSEPGSLIPAAFRGSWLESGSECGDADSEARIGRSAVNFGRLSFIADRAKRPRENRILLVGLSYSGGETKRETASLELGPGGTSLRLQAPELNGPAIFKRCPHASR